MGLSRPQGCYALGCIAFLTDCSLLDDGVVLSTQGVTSFGCFSAYEVILTCEAEVAAASAIRFNNRVIMPAGFTATSEALSLPALMSDTSTTPNAQKLMGAFPAYCSDCHEPQLFNFQV